MFLQRGYTADCLRTDGLESRRSHRTKTGPVISDPSEKAGTANQKVEDAACHKNRAIAWHLQRRTHTGNERTVVTKLCNHETSPKCRRAEARGVATGILPAHPWQVASYHGTSFLTEIHQILLMYPEIMHVPQLCFSNHRTACRACTPSSSIGWKKL